MSMQQNWEELLADARPLGRRDVQAVFQAYGGGEVFIPRDPAFNVALYQPPGPVGAAYIRSAGPIDAITGPAGSGKTVCSIMKVVRFGIAVMPITRDGRIKLKITVLRNNYRALYRTTLKSWFEWFPIDYPQSTFSGGVDRPAVHKLRLSTIRDGREIPVDLDVEFFAVGDAAIDELLKGYETSIVWCNEADQLLPRVITFAYSRTGRYPRRDELPDGCERPRLVACDLNPTAPDHPLWLACEKGTFQEDLPADAPRMIQFFRQPSGLSDQAENRRGKTKAEYEQDLFAYSDPADVDRLVHGRPGFVRIGRPVYVRDFDGLRHVSRAPLAVLPGLPLHIGFDQGLRGAAALFQQSTLGQIRVLDELTTPKEGIGASRFAEWLAVKLRSPRLRDLPLGTFGADPAGFTGADRLAGESSWAMIVAEALGHPIQPAPSNSPPFCIQAVENLLRLQIERDVPGLIIDPVCETLIKGFHGLYVYGRRTDGGFEERPLKNPEAAVQEALQYGVVTLLQAHGVITSSAAGARGGDTRGGRDRDAARPYAMPLDGFSPLAGRGR